MTTTSTAQPHAFSLLLATYISGDVDERDLLSLCDMVEDAPAAERLAFASYYLDAVRDGEPMLPKADEWSEIAGAARA